MGCGAMCGNNSTASQVIIKAAQILKMLVPKIKPNGILLSLAASEKLLKDFEVNANRYQLRCKETIEHNQPVPFEIMEKWKVIIYGLDMDLQAYLNCLGYRKNIDTKCQNNMQKPNQQLDICQAMTINQVLPHPAFQQIDKDLDRTFQFQEFNKQSFKNILRKIANYFPKMGYTQGINFLVGYLLIVGYSENDVFWMFVHLALNQRYMILGLFEDGFPLSNVYTIIFKNILKRQNNKLYVHFYELLEVNDSIWIFKWFISYYLYSFPIEVCKYVWDLVIAQGSIGLVYFAIGLVGVLQTQLLQLQDLCAVSQYFQELKELTNFNSVIKIQQVLKIAYKTTIIESDLQGIDINNGKFYGKYIKIHLKKQWSIQKLIHINTSHSQVNKQIEEALNKTTESVQQKNLIQLDNKNQECLKILQEWYNGKIIQREEFVKMKGISHQKNHKIHLTYTSKNFNKVIKKQPQLIINMLNENDEIEQIQTHTQEQQPKQLKHTFSLQQTTLQKSTSQPQQQSNTQVAFPQQSSYRNFKHKKITFEPQIDQLWDQQQEINESKDKIDLDLDLNPPKMSIQSQAQQKVRRRRNSNYNNNKIQIQTSLQKNNQKNNNNYQYYKQIRGKVKTEQQKITIRFKNKNQQFANKKQIEYINNNVTKNYQYHQYYPKSNQGENKINNTKVNTNTNTLLMVGKSIMSSMSISNASQSNKSSTSSKQNVKKEKENGININYRYCKCNKNKTDGDHNGEESIVKSQKKEEDELKNDERKKQRCSEDYQQNKQAKNSNQRKRLTTYQQWMVNSQLAQPNNSKYMDSVGSEVQILDGGQLFKKKNRVSTRIGGGVGIVACNNMCLTSKEQIIKIPQQNPPKVENEQQSCESIFLPNNSQCQSSGLSGRGHYNQGFEIESVK